MNVAVYLRTSTLEQDPEKQKEECLQFAKTKGYNVTKVSIEKLSGFKDIERPEYDSIKEMARKGEIQAVVVWALDRWVRNRDTLLEDVTILRNYGCKLHSVKESWLEAINIDGSLGKTVQEFLLGLIGSIAELESQRKSERMKMAFKQHTGRKWGRKPVPNVTKEKILILHEQGKSYREICEEVHYWDGSNNKKNVSMGFVHKTIANFKREKARNKEVH